MFEKPSLFFINGGISIILRSIIIIGWAINNFLEIIMFYLGVDSGGTKTDAVLTDESGDILRTTRAGAGNISSLGAVRVAELIDGILGYLLTDININEIEHATFAFAGAGRTKEKESLKTIIKNAGLKNFTVMTDAEILHYSIFGQEPGMLIAAGTGSICLIKADDSIYHQIGGMGFLFGDEGSGFFIGKNAIKLALNDTEAEKPLSELTQELIAFYEIQNPRELITIVYSSTSPQQKIASCAELICQLALQQNPDACKIIDMAAESLKDLAVRAIKYFGQQNCNEYNFALEGGILKKDSIVAAKFKQKANECGLQFRYFEQDTNPAASGVLYSLRKCGKNTPDSLILKLRNLAI